MKTAYGIGKENILYIMGFVPENGEIISKLEDIVENTPNASNAHNIKFDNFASYYIVSMHVQVDADLTVGEHMKFHAMLKRIFWSCLKSDSFL